MLAAVASATICGVEGRPVSVEAHVSIGLPGYTIVGLPDTACRESRDRVRAAMLSSGFEWPNRRITVNLAPSDLRKAGAGTDLAIGLGVLVASEQLPEEALADRGFLGELGLNGAIRPIAGVLPMAAVIDRLELIVPMANFAEAALVGRHTVRAIDTLGALVASLRGEEPWPPAAASSAPPAVESSLDLADVRGQPVARRALEIAAAGGHHLLMVGPPGGGKTMLAERLPGLLGQMEPAAALRATTIHSAAGQPLPLGCLLRRPPFRSPHHSSSLVSIIGGGSHALRPGEVSLASEGVLFLDELGEFPAAVLDALRQPLEQGSVRIARAHASATMPADFLLVAAMNPCPCGFAPAPNCSCTGANLARYARRVSGPILDRLDLRVLVAPPSRHELLDVRPAEPTRDVAARVAMARSRAAERGVRSNAHLSSAELHSVSSIEPMALRMIERALDLGRLSGRGLARLRAVALTIDDLRGGDARLDHEAIAEALALRAELSFAHQRRGAA